MAEVTIKVVCDHEMLPFSSLGKLMWHCTCGFEGDYQLASHHYYSHEEILSGIQITYG